MRPLRAVLLATALLCPAAAHAAVEPPLTAAGRDHLIRSLPYNPSQTIRLWSTGLQPLRLVFEAGEQVVSVAGVRVFMNLKAAQDSGGWFVPSGAKPDKDGNVQPAAIGDAMMLQPLGENAPSIMFVKTTAPDGQPRRYVFEVSTRDGDVTNPEHKHAYVEVAFTYRRPLSAEEIAAITARREAAREERRDRLAHARLVQAQHSAPYENINYWRRDPVGCPVLAPRKVSDDGHHTHLLFTPNQVKPEIYAKLADGKPTLVNGIPETTVGGVRITLPRVYRELILARDGLVCGLHNRAYDAIGTQPGGGTGTISPDVVRQVREARAP